MQGYLGYWVGPFFLLSNVIKRICSQFSKDWFNLSSHFLLSPTFTKRGTRVLQCFNYPNWHQGPLTFDSLLQGKVENFCDALIFCLCALPGGRWRSWPKTLSSRNKEHKTKTPNQPGTENKMTKERRNGNFLLGPNLVLNTLEIAIHLDKDHKCKCQLSTCIVLKRHVCKCQCQLSS